MMRTRRARGRALPALLLSSLVVASAARAAVPEPSAEDFAWEASFSAALERASAEQRPLLLAVLREGQGDSQALENKVHRSAVVRKLAGEVVAFRLRIRGDGAGAREALLGGDLPADDPLVATVDGLFRFDATGRVFAPQHVFATPTGEFLFAVPRLVTPEEFAWCIGHARQRLDRQARPALPREARPPRAFAAEPVRAPWSESTPDGLPQPLTPKETEELLAELRKGGGGRGPGAWRETFGKMRRLLLADDEEAVAFVDQQFARLGTGPGGGAFTNGIVRAVGENSPPGFWKALEGLTKSSDDALRAEVAVALEQLGADASVGAVRNGLRKEKVATLRREWIRALGSAGAGDTAVHKELLQITKARGEAEARHAAWLGLGWAYGNAEVSRYLVTSLSTPIPSERRAAACALALTRDLGVEDLLAEAIARETDEAVKGTFEAAARVLAGAALSEIATDVAELCPSEIPRTRYFGG